MDEGNRVTLIAIIVISVLMLWLFLSGAWFRWNDAFDERHYNFYEGTVR